MIEEIIIDGVDVAGCKKYHKGWCLLSETSYGNVTKFCSENNDCYYKQLKRLEQENKELKEKLDKEEYNACCECTNIQNQNDEYRSALEEIRNDLKEVCKEECDYTKPKFCGNCDCRYGQILNKINEVL